MFWIGFGVVLVIALAAAFLFDRRHRTNRGGGDALADNPDAAAQVGIHRLPHEGGGWGGG